MPRSHAVAAALAAASILALAAGPWGPVAQAQPAVPTGLAPGAVMVIDGFIFAKASAPLRDPGVPLQSLLASRASYNVARWLCQYTPAPGTRLEAPLTRVSVVESRQDGDTLAVTVRLPVQRPECIVRAAPPEPVALPSAQGAAPGALPGAAPGATFTVREYPID